MSDIDYTSMQTMQDVHARVQHLLSLQSEAYTAADWDVLRTAAQEDGDLVQLAACCIVQLLLEE